MTFSHRQESWFHARRRRAGPGAVGVQLLQKSLATGHKRCLSSQTSSIRGASTGTPSVRMATDRQKRAKAAAARQKAARSQKVAKKRNILDRLGNANTTKVVTVRGVGPTVSAVEVRDLFASVGAVDRVTSSLGANTSSTTYEVAFRTPSKARAAVTEFDGRALDGRCASWEASAGCTLVGDGARGDGGRERIGARLTDGRVLSRDRLEHVEVVAHLEVLSH